MTCQAWFLAGTAVLILGIAKAGFGSGFGLLAAPLLAMSLPAKQSVGVLLPILCAIDLVALPHYWRNWDRRNVLFLFPGALIGVVLGTVLLNRLNDNWIGISIGLLAIAFVAQHYWKLWRAQHDTKKAPITWTAGTGFGAAAGFTSTIAHAAGPVATMFLLPQGMDRRRFVGTTVIFFALLNATKVPPYIAMDIIRADTLKISGFLLPFVPVGVFIGLWMNKSINEKWFVRVIYWVLLLAGGELVWKNAAALMQH